MDFQKSFLGWVLGKKIKSGQVSECLNVRMLLMAVETPFPGCHWYECQVPELKDIRVSCHNYFEVCILLTQREHFVNIYVCVVQSEPLTCNEIICNRESGEDSHWNGDKWMKKKIKRKAGNCRSQQSFFDLVKIFWNQFLEHSCTVLNPILELCLVAVGIANHFLQNLEERTYWNSHSLLYVPFAVDALNIVFITV